MILRQGFFRRIYLFLSVFLIGIDVSPAFGGKAVPPAPRSYVYNEGVVSEDSARRIGQELAQIERSTGHQFVVALFQSLEGEILEDYSNKVFKSWKVGDAKRNDGLLLALFKGDRRWRVEVGYGLEGDLTDLEASRVVRESAVPYFRAGDYDGGVESAVGRLVFHLSGGKIHPAAPPIHGRPNGESDLDAIWFAIRVLFILFILFRMLHRMASGSAHIRGGYRGDYGGFPFFGGGFGGGSFGGGGFSGGGFSGGGGSSGGGGASGSW